jgi:signal transduction histidine kinase/AmiR/NasT family two-component response regulator
MSDPSPPSMTSATAETPRPKRALASLGGLLIAVVLAMAMLAIWTAREHTIRQVRQVTDNFAALLASQTSHTLQTVDLAMQVTAEQVHAAGITSPAAFDSALNSAHMHEVLADQLRNLPQATALSVVDAAGKTVVTSGAWPSAPVDMSDRDYVRYLRAHPETATYVGAAERGQAGTDWSIVLARRVSAPTGELLGFIVAHLAQGYFEQFYRAIALLDGSKVSILRRDGTRLLRYPHDDRRIGATIAASSPWYQIVGSGGGDYVSPGRAADRESVIAGARAIPDGRAQSGGDVIPGGHPITSVSGVPNYVSVRPLADYPLVVDVGVTRDAALAGWWHDAISIVVGAFAIVVAIALLFQVLARQFRRLAESERSLAQKNADLERTQHRLQMQATELRRTATALTQSEHLIAEKSAVLETTLEYMGQGIMMVTANRTVAVCNHRAIEMLGLPPELKTPGTPFAHLLAYQWRSDEFKHTPADIQDFIRSGGILDQPHVYARRRPDGRMIEVRSTPLPDGGIVRTYTDVSEHKLAEDRAAQAREQAEQARALAEEASRAKTDFLAHVSHEIRTPMNGIIGMNAILLGSRLNDEQRECAVAVRESAEALLAVINDILDISKLEAGRLELEAIDFDLVELVEAAVGLFVPPTREKGIELSILMDPAVRAGVRGDPTRLRQVVLNLVGNAVKFTETGGVTIEVTQASAGQSRGSQVPDLQSLTGEQPARVRVEVADSGPGIPESVRTRLFEPFAQADNSISRRFGGTGLGLAICRQLVELMGGTIGMTSALGRGSRFFFEIPLARASTPVPAELAVDVVLTKPMREQPLLDTMGRLFEVAATGAPAQAAPDFAREAPNLSPLRVLVAEDNKINQRLMVMLLGAAGHQVDVAGNGQDAVAAVRRGAYDLVLMDIQMPVLDGVGAIRCIRAMEEPRRSVPILALTADAIAGAEERYLAVGVDAYLAKPITPATLQAALVRVTGRRREVDAAGAETKLIMLPPAPLLGPSPARSEPRPAASAVLSAEPALDPAAVAELRRIFSPDQFDDFLADALDDIPQRIVRMSERLQSADLNAAMQEAHDLVALLGNPGGRRASGLARAIEQLCRAGDRATALARYHEFAAAADAALTELAVHRQLVA